MAMPDRVDEIAGVLRLTLKRRTCQFAPQRDREDEHFHLKNMRRYGYFGDVAANDASYYRRHGYPNAFYIRNLWIDRVGTAWRARRERERTDPLVIVGYIGK